MAENKGDLCFSVDVGILMCMLLSCQISKPYDTPF